MTDVHESIAKALQGRNPKIEGAGPIEEPERSAPYRHGSVTIDEFGFFNFREPACEGGFLERLGCTIRNYIRRFVS